MKKTLLTFLAFCLFAIAFPQELYIPRDIQKAYDAGTRSKDGNPGIHYFQNRANYSINAEFNPATRLLKASEKINYQNNSSFSLRYAVVRLYQNIFKDGGVRGREVDPIDTNNGVKINSITIKGKKCDLGSDNCILRESQTNIFIPLNCSANSSVEIEIGWEFTMPSKPNDRFGGYDENTFFMGYWFPQISVFDDINGWDIFDYNAVAEFYNDYGDFDVNITVPENYIVWGTGVLQNPSDVLQKEYLLRYNKALKPGEVVQIITEKDREEKKAITPTGPNVWHFKASNVNDFAFGTSSRYLWDASGFINASGKNIFIQSAYNPDAENFDKVVGIAKWNIEELEKFSPYFKFPYPTMTAFNGIGGMEYPMVINDHDGNLVETIFVTSHEIAHTYFPFMVGTNQRRHGWFDEGLVTMLGMEVHFTRDSSMNLRKSYTEFYPFVAGSQQDIPQIVNSIVLSDNVFQMHEYARSSLAFWTLRDIMGEQVFKNCVNEFARRWDGKHPTPWDFFFTCNNVTGEDYSWFFEPWFNRFAYTDLAVKSAKFENDTIEINIENTGGMPFPSKLITTFTDGSVDIRKLDGKQWINSKLFSIRINTKKQPVSVHLDTSAYPDCNESNNMVKF
jgi:hypothetical protein